MQLHNLQPKYKRKAKKRVGRGGKRGTYSGRGVKGQKSRAGTHKGQPVIREIIKRYPKLRGYRFSGKGKTLAIVNLSEIDRKFRPGEKVNPKTLLSRGIISKIKGRVPEVKILGKGELTKSLAFEGVEMSKNAEAKSKGKSEKAKVQGKSEK